MTWKGLIAGSICRRRSTIHPNPGVARSILEQRVGCKRWHREGVSLVLSFPCAAAVVLTGSPENAYTRFQQRQGEGI